MELKTPMVFVKHIIAAQRGDASSIQYLCDHTSGQFVKICREYDLTNAEIETVLAKAYGTIFANIKSVKNPQNFMSWAGGLVDEYCREIKGERAQAVKEAAPAAKPALSAAKEAVPAAKPAVPVEKPAAPVAPVAPAVVPAAAAAAAVPVVQAVAPKETAAAIPAETVAPTGGMTEDKLLSIMKKWADEESRKVEPYVDKVNAHLEQAEEKVPEVPAETSTQPTAFYDENAYLEPAETFNEELNYADETPEAPVTPDKRIIPVDELVYHPHANYFSSDEPGTEPKVEEAPVQAEPEAPAYEEEPVETEPETPAYEEEPVQTEPEAPVYENEPLPVAESKPVFQSKVVSSLDDLAAYRQTDEPDIDLIEKEEPAVPETVTDPYSAAEEVPEPTASEPADTETEIGVTDDYNENDDDEEPDYDEDDMDDEEIKSGLAFRTKILVGLLCVFVFGACIGVGYAISKGMTAGSSDGSSTNGYVESQTETEAESVTETESLVESLMDSALESLAESDSSAADSSAQTESATTSKTESTSGVSQTSGSAAAGEVTAKPDISKYLGGTFAAVFRDYPDIPHTVYRGELSLVNEYIGFLGSYNATKPVSSTMVESVSLLGEADNFNINGFYVGMSANDAASLASAGGYTETDLSAESSLEYTDADGNILTLTVDAGLIKNVTLRVNNADTVALQNADDITDQTENAGGAQTNGNAGTQPDAAAETDNPEEAIEMPSMVAGEFGDAEEDENGGVG